MSSPISTYTKGWFSAGYCLFCLFLRFPCICSRRNPLAGRYVQIMGVMFAVRFAIIPLSHTLNILERQDLYLLWDGTRLALVVGGLWVGKTLEFSHITAVSVYSLSMLTAYVFLWSLTWRALKSRSKVLEDLKNVCTLSRSKT